MVEYPKILISGDFNVFAEGWNASGVYMGSGNYKSETFSQPIYIGSAAGEGGLGERIEAGHISKLERNCHPHNPPLQIAWNNHAHIEGFVWWLLEPCTKDNQFEIEQKYLDLYRPFVDEFGGFNIAHRAEGGGHMKGRKSTEETKKKISNSLRGNVPWNKGIECTEETKSKLSKKLKGRKPSPEICSKISKIKKEFYKTNPHHSLGRKHTEESKEKIREKNLGRKHSPEALKKISETHHGKIVSQDTKDKIGDFFSKSFEIVSPDGEVFTGKNLSKFAKEHGLSRSHLGEVILGKLKHHKGWRIFEESNLKPFEKNPRNPSKIKRFGKFFKIKSPDGKIYESNNIKQFSLDHGLNSNSLARMIRGERSEYKGWKNA